MSNYDYHFAINEVNKRCEKIIIKDDILIRMIANKDLGYHFLSDELLTLLPQEKQDGNLRRNQIVKLLCEQLMIPYIKQSGYFVELDNFRKHPRNPVIVLDDDGGEIEIEDEFEKWLNERRMQYQLIKRKKRLCEERINQNEYALKHIKELDEDAVCLITEMNEGHLDRKEYLKESIEQLIQRCTNPTITCAICTQDKTSNMWALECGHTFCSICTPILLSSTNPRCPTCRHNITTSFRLFL